MIKGSPGNWRIVKLHGATELRKLVGIYELSVKGLVRFIEFKVFERKDDFIAFPNAAKKNSDGYPDWTSGLGKSEVEALQDGIMYLMKDFSTISDLNDDKIIYRDDDNIIKR